MLFDDAHAASTVARFSTEGTYVLRLTATDGEISSSADVTVQGEAATRGVNVAPDATPTAEYTAGWNNVNAVNNGTHPVHRRRAERAVGHVVGQPPGHALAAVHVGRARAGRRAWS